MWEPPVLDVEAARAHGRVFGATRAAGRTSRTRFADRLIAATTAAHGLPLYARNTGDFLGFDGIVRVVGVRPVWAHESPRRYRLLLSDAISTGER